MPEFLNLLPPQEALERLLGHPLQPLASEVVATADALGRVTAAPLMARDPLPSFPRSTVDGYAVRAADTFGASDSLPAYLQQSGEVLMGSQPDFELQPGGCALIHTGGMLPGRADAVVMIEQTQPARAGEVEILKSVAVGENVLKVGEDVAQGDEVIPAGTRLRPAEIGGLMALGEVQVSVMEKPRVGILSSGDEVVPPEAALKPGQVRDVNAYTLSALVQQAGGIPVRYGIVRDQAARLKQVASQALQECHVVVITAGSSASVRDLTAEVIGQLGQPGVLVHGVNVRPGKPTILAVCDGKIVIGLPGNPVSALVIASLFVVPVLQALSGLRQRPLAASLTARLTINLSSQTGREDWVAVRLISSAGQEGRVSYLAEPVFGKSNLIFTLARADGLIRIDPDATGLTAGQVVEVFLF